MNRKKAVSLAGILALAVTVVFANSNERGIDLYRAELYNAAKIFFNEQPPKAAAEQAEAYYYLGQSYSELGQPDSAAWCYNKAVETKVDYPFGYVGQGKQALKSNPKVAEDLFKKAIGFAKKDASVYTTIAEAYVDAKMLPQAKEYLEKARKANKKYPGIYLVEGDILKSEGKLGEANANYDNAIYYDKNFKLAYLKLARVYKYTSYTTAIGYLNDLIAIDPNYIPAYAEIGDINRANGKYQQAIEAYEKFISIPGVPILQHDRYAQLLYFTGKYAESLEKIKYVLQFEPNNLVMHRLEGYNNYELENYALAAEQLTQFLAENPDSDHIYLDYITLGRALSKEKKWDEAIAVLQKAAQKENKSEVYDELAAAYNSAGDYPEAVSVFEKYLEMEPDAGVIKTFNYGQYNYNAASQYVLPDYLNAKRTPEEQAADDAIFNVYVEKASKAFSSVEEQNPDSYLGPLWNGKINSLLDAKEQKATGKATGHAKPYYEKAVEIMLTKESSNALNRYILEAYKYLSSYYYQQFDSDKTPESKAKAIEYFQKVVTMAPNEEGSAKVLEYLQKLK